MSGGDKEKRKPIRCPKCQTEMVCMRMYNIEGDAISIWYICPRRKHEEGCGYKMNIRIDHFGKLIHE